MLDFEIARYLYRVAFLYGNIYDSTFKSRAYYKAALAIDGYSANIEKLYHEGNLRSLPSIGLSIEKNIMEIISSNHLKLIDELLDGVPYSIFDLYEYSNIKPKLLIKLLNKKIFSFGHISNILEQHVNYLSLSERQELNIALKHYEVRSFQYAQVYELAKDLLSFLRNSELVYAVNLSDELYLHKESLVSGDVICTIVSDFELFLSEIKSAPLFQFISFDEKLIILKRYGIPFKVHILSKNEFNEKMKKLLIEKEKRQVQSSNKRDILQFFGDLHLHTDWSDGLHSIEQMRDMAVELGYSYIAVTDHSQSSKPLGMSELDALTQIKKIREINKKSLIPVLSGIEVDILADGSLDLPDTVLKEFDIVIASIHSHFNQSPIELRERLERALSNKYVNILAHPMCRLLGRPGKPTVQRKEIQITFENLLQLCKDHCVALEINCFPERLDLSINNAKQVVAKGIKIAVGTDSHSIYHMDCAKYALESLQFVNFPPEAILNCHSLNELKKILSIRRSDNDNSTVNIFEEKLKNFNHYFADNEDIFFGRIKAVGIDLTGSEKKASGFAVISGTSVQTFLMLTDDEIVENISTIRPNIVSIDSPLSFPEGRCCGDKYCNCASRGIMRYCELLLRHFGIGVYPCLIDSMVNLTLRGIKLSARLRSLGFNTIESYPGVAQDLLHIPRKRKGLELLINGMKNFGIEGMRKDITHDEADAITSALVGYFYINNKYIGIGREREDYLIVPKLETYLTGKGVILGLVGRIAVGKTTVAEYLRFKYGFTSMRFSQIIEEKYKISGRKELQKIGLEISNDNTRQKELSDIMIHRIEDGENYVIEGMRQMIDYENLSCRFGKRFILICIEAPISARIKRFYNDNSNVAKDEFAKIDAHAVEGTIEKISNMRNYEVNNNKGYKELMSKVDTILLKLSR